MKYNFIDFGLEEDDLLLSRFACYLIVQNGDPRNPQIAKAKSYFVQVNCFANFIGIQFPQRRLLGGTSPEMRKVKHSLEEVSTKEIEYEEDNEKLAGSLEDSEYNSLRNELLKVREKKETCDHLTSKLKLSQLSISSQNLVVEMTNFNIHSKGLSNYEYIQKEYKENENCVIELLKQRGIIP